MPVTRRAAGVLADRRSPDYHLALKPVRELGIAPGDPVLTLATHCVRAAQADQTARQYGWLIARFLRWLSGAGILPLEATRDDLLLWWNSSVALSSSTRSSMLNVVRAFYREAQERDLIARNPAGVIKGMKREVETGTPALTCDQAVALIDTIRADLGHPDRDLLAHRDLAIVALMLRICLREGEVQGLRWRQFYEDQGQPVVHFIGKWHKPATLGVPDDVGDALRSWRAAYRRDTGVELGQNDPLFVALNPGGLKDARRRRPGVPLRAVCRPTLYTIVAQRLAAIGLQGNRYGPHCLRATGLTLAYEGGADLLQCQALARHSSVETTRLYVKRVDSLARPATLSMGITIPKDRAEDVEVVR